MTPRRERGRYSPRRLAVFVVLVSALAASGSRSVVGGAPHEPLPIDVGATVGVTAERGPSIQLSDPPPAPLPPPPLRQIHLTFDDGPAAQTAAVLDVLARYDARATFFVIGQQVGGGSALVRRMANAGHVVANHTWSHPRLAGLSQPAFVSQIQRTQTAVVGVTGRSPRCLRPPYGSMDRNTVPWAASLGLRVVMWDVDPQDWRQPGAGAIASRVINAARPGAVVLLHDGGGNRNQTVGALSTILGQLSARGYSFTPVPGC